MSPSVSFLNIVNHWWKLLRRSEQAAYREAVYDAWQERDRMERLVRRFSEALDAEQRALSERVAVVWERCAADVQIAKNDDYRRMTASQQRTALEETIAGAALVMRNHLPIDRRREITRLVVDWKDSSGAAQWEGQGDVGSGFTIRNAVTYAAAEMAGMREDLAIAVAERLTAEFRGGAVELTGLRKTGEAGLAATYEWESASVSLAPEAESVGQPAPALPPLVESALRVWLWDQWELSDAELRRLAAHRPLPRVWERARQLVDGAEPGINPAIVYDVMHFIQMCVEYSGDDRKAIAQEIALTAYHSLAVDVAENREDEARWKAILVKTIEREESAGSTANFAAAAYRESQSVLAAH